MTSTCPHTISRWSVEVVQTKKAIAGFEPKTQTFEAESEKRTASIFANLQYEQAGQEEELGEEGHTSGSEASG